MGRMVSKPMPKADVLYEGMYILQAGLDEAQIQEIEDRLKAGIEALGAVVESTHEYGRRRLAYKIKGHTEGIYRVMYFRGSGEAVEELNREYGMIEQVVRGHVVIANPEFMVGRPRPSARPAEEGAAEGEAVAEGEAEAPPIEEASAAVEEASAAEEAPAVEEAPAAEETPAVEEAPEAEQEQ